MKKLFYVFAILAALLLAACPVPENDPQIPDEGKTDEGGEKPDAGDPGCNAGPEGAMVSMSADLNLWTMDCTFYAFAEEPEGDPFNFGHWCLSDQDPRVFIYKQFGTPEWAETMITYTSSWKDVPVTVVWENGFVEENSKSAEVVLLSRGTEPGTWAIADLSELGKTYWSAQCWPAIKFGDEYWPMMSCLVYVENKIAERDGKRIIDFGFDGEGKLLDLKIGVAPPSGGSYTVRCIWKDGRKGELYSDFTYDAEYTDGTVAESINLASIVKEGKILESIACKPVKGGSVGESFVVRLQ